MVKRNEPDDGRQYARRRMDRIDLAFRAVLVVCLWAALHFLNAEITQTVVIATFAAVFGPDVLRAGFDQLSGRTSGRR